MRRWSRAGAALAVLGSTVAGCGADPGGSVAAGGAGELASSAQDFPSPLASPEWLAANLDRDDLVVIQIESQENRYRESHIPGARFLSVDDIAWEGDQRWGVELRAVDDLERALAELGISNHTYVVITGSRTTATGRLWMTLDYLGHGDRSSLLDGGLQGWEAEGRPLASGASPTVAPATFTANVRPDMQVDADWIAARLDDPAVALLDARPDDEYTGADGGMGGVSNPGHIPGAVQLYWEDLTVEGNPHKFKDPAQLAARFEQSGALRDGLTVSYCMVGLRASVNYMVGRMLGYDMRFYDGSWHDWGTRADLPYVGGTEPGGA